MTRIQTAAAILATALLAGCADKAEETTPAAEAITPRNRTRFERSKIPTTLEKIKMQPKTIFSFSLYISV